MLKIILLIIYIAAILAVIFIERKNPTEAMLWALVMVCIPYLGSTSLSCVRQYYRHQADVRYTP